MVPDRFVFIYYRMIDDHAIDAFGLHERHILDKSRLQASYTESCLRCHYWWRWVIYGSSESSGMGEAYERACALIREQFVADADFREISHCRIRGRAEG
jgi:hypothetical protein